MDTHSRVVTRPSSRRNVKYSAPLLLLLLPLLLQPCHRPGPSSLPPPLASRLSAHAVKSSAQQCGPLWARGLIRGGSSSRCPPLPEFQLCQQRCRGVGLNWWTSTEARTGSRANLETLFSFGLYGRAGECQTTRKEMKIFKKKRERTEFIVEDKLKNCPAVVWVKCGYLAQQQGSGTTALFVQHNNGSQKVPFSQLHNTGGSMRASDLSRRSGGRKETNSYT